MISTMSRLDDTIRPLRSYRGDANEDVQDPPPLYAAHSVLVRDEVPPQATTTNTIITTTTKPLPNLKLLTQEETLELTRRKVENGIQETKRSLAGSEKVEDVVRPKLTIDLGHSNIGWIPDSLVDIIKDEVARLSLSNNHIDHVPYRFSECIHLRYLNIRANDFTEFPKEVLSLSFLEILDLSRNKITQLPEDIRNLTSLRVLSIMQNLLDDLPAELSKMNKLQVLKVSGNVLKYPLKRVLEMKEADISMLADITDNEKEAAITSGLKKYLRNRQLVESDVESNTDASETTIETPKPFKKRNRFPVIPQSSRSDSGHQSRSPSISRPPPIPVRSHHRIASGQSSQGSLHRLVTTPGSGGSERNRSNSEGVIQASSSSRSKRMGLIRKNTDLGTLDETRPYRNSHLRGLSHGSLLRSKNTTDGSSSSSPSSPKERRRLREGSVRRMSSLPEHRVKARVTNPIIEGAKGVLYSLFQIHPHVSSLINVIRSDDTRRNSLEIVFYNASTHIDQLNEALENAINVDFKDAEAGRRATDVVKRECETCLMAYIHVVTQLRRNTVRVVLLADPRYIRSLLLMIYGSLTELRNACGSLGISLTPNRVSNPSNHKQSDTEAMTNVLSEPAIEPSATPTRERYQPASRMRSETTVKLPSANLVSNFPQSHPNSAYFTASNIPPIAPLNVSSRSRSSSRSNTLLNSSLSSFANTPRSGESFSSLAPANIRLSDVDELEEERSFERIFVQLTSAYTLAHQALPTVARQFSHFLEVAEETRSPLELRALWHRLLYRCRLCLDSSEALRVRLSNMKLKEPGGGIRNQKDFWQLCKTFIQAFIELVTDMREAKNLRVLPQDVVMALRPVQKAIRDAGRLIDGSAWSYLAELNTSNPSGAYPPHLQTTHMQQYSNSSTSTIMSGSTLTNGSSPQSVPLPATPLSAALGPAAQATVPSTPISATSDRFFAGDVFQRADSLLQSVQAPMFYRR
ncbi:hypothetical protein AJ80_00738 [Polytolypa hystricis UAMH7299]|uniref:Disease resistance R13L4/SHOC-2-like LRR domain-containing protein n=1 Tax=Polytolypa hystricis (strain UAMH7299) TaxID=1447883 RepID=A0A2B7Z3U4_POLH7|nr:hypothetical protein AJ80_00738 [Polytolypa hystricis UAMH7299]